MSPPARATSIRRPDAIAAPRGGRLTWGVVGLVAALALLELPRWLSASVGPPDRVLAPTLRNIFDANVYLAAERQARDGAWSYVNQFTAELHNPAVVHVLYLALGHLSAATGFSLDAVFSAAEVLGRAAVLLAALALARGVLEGRARSVGLVLAVAGGSLAFWAALASALAGAPPSESLYFEDDTLTALFSAPHLQLGLAGVLVAVPCLELARRRRGLGAACLAAVFAVVALTVSYALAPLLAWLWLDTLVWHRDRGSLAVAAAATAVVAVPLAYNAVTFTLDPFWGAVLGRQNVVPTPRGCDFLVHVGAGLLLMPTAFLAWRGCWTDARRSLVLQTAVTLAALFLPVPYQRRLGIGLEAQLGILSAAGLVWLARRVPAGPARLLAVAIAAAAFFPTTMASYAAIATSAVSGQPYPVYVASRAELDGARALEALAGPHGVTLASLETSYAIVPALSGRVAVGHPHETLGYVAKQRLLDAFFASHTDEERATLLSALGATHIFVGSRERQLLAFDPNLSSVLHLDWESVDRRVAIYRVIAPS